MMLYQRSYGHVSHEDGKCLLLPLAFANIFNNLEFVFLFHCGLTSVLMKMYKQQDQATYRYLYVMGNALHLEGLVILNKECTKQAEAYLAKQMRIIAVPNTIQNGFWASPTCDWLLTALEVFSDGWVFGRPIFMIPGPMKHQSFWNYFCSLSIHCENELRWSGYSPGTAQEVENFLFTPSTISNWAHVILYGQV